MNKLQTCEECGRGGYNHKRLGFLVDGELVSEITVCRPCSYDIEKAVKTDLNPAHAQKR